MNSLIWQQIESLYHQALELQSNERDRFIEQHCDGDADLLREVRELLKAEQETGQFMEHAVEHVVDQFLGDIQPKRLQQRIGAYRLVRQLGQGGMGTVYLAHRADAQFEQQVAIKLIQWGSSDPETVKRFQLERQILANLKHPNIATLLDGGTTEDGMPYLVMEYVEGEPIDQYCDRQQLNLQQRLSLFQTVCDATQYAHQNLVVHRDLKPSNILVTKGGQAKLLDFGIAKLLDQQAMDAETPVTQTRMIRCTPEHASPEQLLGQTITTASDVYSLGILLYKLLAGRLPFADSATTPQALEHAIRTVTPPAPSRIAQWGGASSAPEEQIGGESTARQPQWRRQLRGDLDNIALMALRKEPQRRYRSVEQFSQDIQHYLDGLPVIARTDTWAYRANKFIRRHRSGVAISIAGILALLMFVIHEQDLRREAQHQARLAQQQTAKANAASDFLVDVFTSADPNKSAGHDLTIKEVLDRAGEDLEKADHALKRQPLVEAKVQQMLGQMYIALGKPQQAQRHLHRAQSLGTDRDPVEYIATLRLLANATMLVDEYTAAETLHRQAVADARRLLGEDHPETMRVLTGLGAFYYRRGRYSEALTLQQEVLHRQRTSLGTFNPETLLSMRQLADTHTELGNYPQAEALFKEFLQGAAVLGEDNTEIIYGKRALGSLYARQGQLDRGEPLIRQSVKQYTRVLGADHPRTLESQLHLGQVSAYLGQTETAEKLLRDTLVGFTRVSGPDGLLMLYTQDALARVISDQGRYAEAEEMYRDLVRKESEVLGERHPMTLHSTSMYAIALTHQGKYHEAERLLLQVVGVQVEVMGEHNPQTLDSQHALAQVYLGLGSYELAAQYAKQTLKSREAVLGAQDSVTLATAALLDRILEIRDRTNTDRIESNQ